MLYARTGIYVTGQPGQTDMSQNSQDIYATGQKGMSQDSQDSHATRQQGQTDVSQDSKDRDICYKTDSTERERERGGGETETDRQTDRQTDRERVIITWYFPPNQLLRLY